jgi:dihydrofolate reductase
MSLDGYVVGPIDSQLPIPADERFDPEPFNAYNLERLRAASTLLLGRTTYDLFVGYWPTVAANEGAGPVERAISRIDNAIEKAVISNTLTPEQTGPWRDTTRIIKRGSYEEIVAMKHQGNGDILTFGSATMWKDLLAYGLVDELHLMVDTAVVGGGTRAFDGPIAGPLRLAETRTWGGSGNILLRYEVLPI